MKKNTKVGYVDGFVLVVPKSKVAVYRTLAREGKRLWMKHGALDYKECVGDDLTPPSGGPAVMAFPKLVKLKKNETVWFSYIGFKDRKHRDQVNAKVMKDPSMPSDPNHMQKMPFDMKRMAYGGFRVIVSA